MDPILDKLTKTRARMLLSNPWFGAQAMHLKFVEDNEHPTFSVDGTHMFFNREFAGSLNSRVLEFVLAHEVLHCSLRHCWRRNGRDAKTWNIATDYAINQILKDSGFMIHPQALLDSKFQGMTADQIYDLVRSEQRKQKNGAAQGQSGQSQESDQGTSGEQGEDSAQSPSGAGTGDSGEGSPQITGEVVDAPQKEGSGMAEAEEGNSEFDWQIATEQATRAAMKAGKMPGHLARLMEDSIRESNEDWVSILREFLQRLAPSNYSFRTPNRRIQGVTLPGIQRDVVGSLVLAVDTSGSVDEAMFKQFSEEFSSIVEEVRPHRVILIQADTRVSSYEEVQIGAPIELSRIGGGGTKFQPVFDKVHEEGEDPAALLYFTDLLPSDAPEEPDYPVLWVSPSWCENRTGFGQHVRISGVK